MLLPSFLIFWAFVGSSVSQNYPPECNYACRPGATTDVHTCCRNLGLNGGGTCYYPNNQADQGYARCYGGGNPCTGQRPPSNSVGAGGKCCTSDDCTFANTCQDYVCRPRPSQPTCQPQPPNNCLPTGCGSCWQGSQCCSRYCNWDLGKCQDLPNGK